MQAVEQQISASRKEVQRLQIQLASLEPGLIPSKTGASGNSSSKLSVNNPKNHEAGSRKAIDIGNVDKIRNYIQSLRDLNTGLQRKCESLQPKGTGRSSNQQQANQQLLELRKQNAQMREQNRTLKADNKIIVAHLDRLKQESLKPQPPDPVKQRQMRVIQSLYQNTPPRNEPTNPRSRELNQVEEFKNTHLLKEASQDINELKKLIRRLNEEIEALKREKSILMEENRCRGELLERQKQLVTMREEANDKNQSVILKMGEKLMSLENLNETLRQKLRGQDEAPQDSYYRETRTKAGQFYYRR